MKTNWNYPTSLWVGENRVKDLTLACQNLKIKKPLFVTDKDLINLPIVKNIISELENSFNQINVFSNFSGNPIGENVDESATIQGHEMRFSTVDLTQSHKSIKNRLLNLVT